MRARTHRTLSALLLFALLQACASAGVVGGSPAGPGAEPAGDAAPRPELKVVYPPAGATLTASDSSFIFGSVRPAGAVVTVNGVAAHQAPGGGWLAWVPVSPGDFTFEVKALVEGAVSPASSSSSLAAPAGAAGGSRESPGIATLAWRVRVPGAFEASWGGVLDTASVSPRVRMELHPGDPVRVTFEGVRGLTARAVLLNGAGDSLASAPFLLDAAGQAADGRRVFGPAGAGVTPVPRDQGTESGAPRWARYRAEIVLPLPWDGEYAADRERERSACAVTPSDRCPPWRRLAIEVVRPGGPTRYLLPGAAILLRDPANLETVVLDDDPQGKGHTDGRVTGRTAPDGVYFLFLPNGTRTSADRRVGDSLELRLADDLSVWVAATEARSLPEGTPRPSSRVPAVRTLRSGEWTRIVVPLEVPLPVQVRQQTDPARYTVTIFGARAATEFLRDESGDRLVREMRWNQATTDRFVLEVELNQRQPWGYRYGYEGSDFYLDVRRAPALRSGLFRSILKGLRIVVDPGHSPDTGATGPTGLIEKDVNLEVALELARELRGKGARVTLTRSGENPEGSTLNDRTNLAAGLEADLLVSVHHNALPDGVNPFVRNGSSTYFYQPQSQPLARAIQNELLRQLGLSDFGVALGNLALVRPTEMPAALSEAAFMMIPEQEELLRTEEFRKREAKAIRKGIERFLEEARRSTRETAR